MKIVIPGVRGLLFDGDGRLLLQKRGDFLNWGLPAGVVDVGDSALEALRREVKEETGIEVLGAAPFGLYSDPKYSVTYPNGDEVQTFTIVFLFPNGPARLRLTGWRRSTRGSSPSMLCRSPSTQFTWRPSKTIVASMAHSW